ncbi:MAG: RNA 3'-phosphate cyclase [Anaerolineae bacterium]|nr:RNA 3'-phosphate cyclase [Anaerolineae bacterium]
MTELLTINGAHGEGGGQVLRSTLTLSALTCRPVQILNIRANRSKPGLRPQHLTAVRAVAAICNAQLEGDTLNSQSLTFIPQTPPQPGTYTFDVGDVSQGGSAGSVTLILQTLLLPLALARGKSMLTLRGGTTVPMSPPALYVEQVFLPMLFEMGVRARVLQHQWGLYPQGGGELGVEIAGNATLRPLDLTERGSSLDVKGCAFVSQLPSHIPQRMSDRARSVLRKAGLSVHIEPQHVIAQGAGAGIFLLAHYERVVAGFTALGRRGLPSEEVAEIVCRELLAYHRTDAAVDAHLADQLVLPFILAQGASRATISRITPHLLTNVWVVQQFGTGKILVEGKEGGPGDLVVTMEKLHA